MSGTGSNNAESGRILIIHTDGNTFNNPSLKCIVDLLLGRGFTIDLRYPKTFAPMPPIEHVRLIPYGKIVRRLKRIIFDRLCFRPLMVLAIALEQLLYYRKYDLILGVDRQGLLEADIISRSTKAPFIFISFEITFASETSARYKSLEKTASMNVSCWIVQDDERADKLKQENGFEDFNKFLLPLASAGMGQTSETRLRDKLGIPIDKKVAIVIGSVSSWSMTREIVRSVPAWPDDWVLILHERYGRTREQLANDLAAIEGLVGTKIYISESATELVDDMAEILSGIDAGLAFYKPVYNGGPLTGNNLKYLGLASGKLSTYLRYRVPVVVNEIGLFAQQVRQFRIGSVVAEPEQVGVALNELGDCDYRGNIETYFKTRLDFNLYADRLMSAFESAMKA